MHPCTVAAGEFGGIGKFTPEHEWDPAGSFAAQNPAKQPTVQAWMDVYTGMVRKIASDIPKGQSAAIYTQLTDVEQEVRSLKAAKCLHLGQRACR